MFPQNIPETPLSHAIPNKASASHSTPPTQPSKFRSISPEKSTEKKVGKWTPDEDELLRKYVSLYSEKQWKKVSEHIPGRTPIQCLHRWTKILKPGLVKGPWTQEEDQKLIGWVKKEGPGKWAQAANLIPGRSGKQCRERWFNNLNPEVKKGNWSTAEDELIFDLYQKYGSSWSKIAKYIPGRTENSIKNRFYSTLRKLAAAKHRTIAGPLGSDYGKLESAMKNMQINPSDMNLRAEGSGSEQDPNILYNLLQESTYKPDQQHSQANTDDLNVKQEEGAEVVEKVGYGGQGGKESKKMEDKKEKVTEIRNKGKHREQEEEKSGVRQTTELNKLPLKPQQAFNVNGEKVVLQRDVNMPEQAIYEAANKLIQSNMDENDLNFQRYLLALDNNTYNNDLLIRDPASTKPIPKNFDDIDVLQQKILDFCSRNVHDLMSAFKSISVDESVNNPKELKDLLQRQLQTPAQDQVYTQNYNPILTNLLQDSERLSLLQNKQGFRRSQAPQQQPSILINSMPLTPISLKIPPLESKGQEEVKIPKFMGFADKDLSSVISSFPNKTSKEKPEKFSLENKESIPSVLLERKNNNNNEQLPNVRDTNNKIKGPRESFKPKSELESLGFGGDPKGNESLDSLIKSMNSTIGTASLVYSQHLAQINDALKNMDQKDGEEAKEKVSGLFQQLYGLETWLRNAKTELAKLENFMHSQESLPKLTGENMKSEANIGQDKSKRRFADENVDNSKLDQPAKKRKVE